MTISGTNTFTGGLTIKQGTVSATSVTTIGGTGGNTGTVFLGDTTGTNSATLLGNGNTFINPIVVQAGTTGTLSLGNSGNTSAVFNWKASFHAVQLSLRRLQRTKKREQSVIPRAYNQGPHK